MPITTNREYRSMTNLTPVTMGEGQKRIDSDAYVEGYAATYEPYLLHEIDGVKYYECFARGCFEGCDMADIIMQYDHSGRVFARTRNNTLIVEPDDNGLFICADLSKSDGSRELYNDIKAGLIDRMSWAFVSAEYSYNKDTHTLTHNKIKKIYDVSAVSIPANDNTSIYTRNGANGVIGDILQELQTRDKLKLKLKTMEK